MASRNLEQEFDTLRGDLEKLRTDIAALTRVLGDTARDAVEDGERRARDYVREAGARIDEAGRAARQQAQDGIAAVEQQIGERPLSSVLVAFGIGVLIGKLLDR